MIHRICTVFNAKQIDGIPPYTPKHRADKALDSAGAPQLRRETAEYVAACDPGSGTVD